MLSLRPAVVALAALLALWLLPGCVQTVRSQAHPALGDQSEGLGRVAILPLRVSGALARSSVAAGPTPPLVGRDLVARHLAEALAERGVTVIPAGDVARALGLEPGERAVDLRSAARSAAEEFGVRAVLAGEVSRFVERQGEAAGTLRPASVAFQVTLHAAPGGQPLWTGSFDETQRALSENIFNAQRYPGGGTRWLTAEELARWGAREVVKALPLLP